MQTSKMRTEPHTGDVLLLPIAARWKFFQNFSQTVAKLPSRVVCLKLSQIADPPEVVADPLCYFHYLGADVDAFAGVRRDGSRKVPGAAANR